MCVQHLVDDHAVYFDAPDIHGKTALQVRREQTCVHEATVLVPQALLSRKSMGGFAHRIPATHTGVIVDDGDLPAAADGDSAGGGAMVAVGTGVSAVVAVGGARGFAKEV